MPTEKQDPCKYPILRTNNLLELCERGQSICHQFGEKIIGNSTLRLVETNYCFNLVNEWGLVVGKIVPRMIEDEIWYGVTEPIVDESKFPDPRGTWCLENTPYNFYNIDCNEFV